MPWPRRLESDWEKALISGLNFIAVPDLALNFLSQVKHPEPSVCLHSSLLFPTNRFYSHEMAVFGWFDLGTYQLVIAFALMSLSYLHFTHGPQDVETLPNCFRESFMQIPETTKRCMHNWFLALPGFQFLVDKTLEKVFSERWASGCLRVTAELKLKHSLRMAVHVVDRLFWWITLAIQFPWYCWNPGRGNANANGKWKKQGFSFGGWFVSGVGWAG